MNKIKKVFRCLNGYVVLGAQLTGWFGVCQRTV